MRLGMVPDRRLRRFGLDVSEPCAILGGATTTGRSMMRYAKHEAKDHARDHMCDIRAAAMNPFGDDLALDEAGLRSDIRRWIDDLCV